VQLLRAGTSTPISALASLDVTFVDVDGDAVPDSDGSTYSLYEMIAVPSATSRTLETATSLTGDTFTASNTLYAIASQAVNVATDFASSPLTTATPSVSAPAIATFQLSAANSFKMLLGGRSALPSQADRGMCFYLYGVA